MGKSGEREAGASPKEARVRRDWRLAENQTRRWVRLFTGSMQLHPVRVR